MPAEKSSLLLFYLFADSSVKIFGAKFGLLSSIKLAKPLPTTALKASVFEVILVCIFSAFGLGTERYGISLYSFRIRENAGKMRTRITLNTETFYAVNVNALLSFTGLITKSQSLALQHQCKNTLTVFLIIVKCGFIFYSTKR